MELVIVRVIFPPKTELFIIKVEGVERVLAQTKMVSLPKTKLLLLPVLTQILKQLVKLSGNCN